MYKKDVNIKDVTCNWYRDGHSFDFEKADCLIELHLHLDGSLSAENIKNLGRLSGIPIDMTEDELERTLRVSEDCTDLNTYLEKFDFPLKFLQTPECVEAALLTLLSELERGGVMYAEVRFAPSLHRQKGYTMEEILKGAVAAAEGSPIPCKLIVCCMRGEDTHEDNLESVRLAAKYSSHVAAVDLAGAEALFPNELFCDEISLARELGVPLTLHAGEASGCESVSSAVFMGASRMGHGVRAYEDPHVMEMLAEKNIFLELCPTSNLNTAVFKSLEEYPLRIFLEKGVKFGINTDNMSVSSTNQRAEWKKIRDVFSLSDGEIYDILMNSLEASFTTEQEKERMRNSVKAAFEDFCCEFSTK